MRLLHLLVVTWCVMFWWECRAYKVVDQCSFHFVENHSNHDTSFLMALMSSKDRCEYLDEFYNNRLDLADFSFRTTQKELNKMDFQSYSDPASRSDEFKNQSSSLKATQKQGHDNIAAVATEGLYNLQFLKYCKNDILVQKLRRIKYHQGQMPWVQNSPLLYERLTPLSIGGEEYLTVRSIENVLLKSNDYEERLEVWNGWYDEVIKQKNASYTTIMQFVYDNSRENGFANIAERWLMKSGDFGEEMDRLMKEIKPLYLQLHAYVRKRIFDHYVSQNIDEETEDYLKNHTNPIPIHLINSVFQQNWGTFLDLLQPDKLKNSTFLSAILKEKDFGTLEMFHAVDDFYVSMGLETMPKSFWNVSIFTNIDNGPNCTTVIIPKTGADDNSKLIACVPISYHGFNKMAKIRAQLESFEYWPFSLTNDVILRLTTVNAALMRALSWSVLLPKNLERLGLLTPDWRAEENDRLLKMALHTIPLMMSNYVYDKWRLKVFRGEIEAEDYDKELWKLRKQYQGLKADRDNANLDYTVDIVNMVDDPKTGPTKVTILFFQFFAALCSEAGFEGALSKCDLFDSKEAGNKIKEFYATKIDQPFDNLMNTMVGTNNVSAGSLMKYYEPLMVWLKEQNKDEDIGWDHETPEK